MHQRTINVHERIPLDEIKEELNADEVLMAEEINKIVNYIFEGYPHKFDESYFYSWDEILMVGGMRSTYSYLQSSCAFALYLQENPETDFIPPEYVSACRPAFERVLFDGRLRPANLIGLKIWAEFQEDQSESLQLRAGIEWTAYKEKEEASQRGREAVAARYAKDEKQAEKQRIKEEWKKLSPDQRAYGYKAAFARQMEPTLKHLTDSDKIKSWCREWEKEETSSALERKVTYIKVK